MNEEERFRESLTLLAERASYGTVTLTVLAIRQKILDILFYVLPIDFRKSIQVFLLHRIRRIPLQLHQIGSDFWFWFGRTQERCRRLFHGH
jgi:hypothetical protein